MRKPCSSAKAVGSTSARMLSRLSNTIRDLNGRVLRILGWVEGSKGPTRAICSIGTRRFPNVIVLVMNISFFLLLMFIPYDVAALLCQQTIPKHKFLPTRARYTV